MPTMSDSMIWWALALIPGFVISVLGGILGIYVGLKLQHLESNEKRRRRKRFKERRRRRRSRGMVGSSTASAAASSSSNSTTDEDDYDDSDELETRPARRSGASGEITNMSNRSNRREFDIAYPARRTSDQSRADSRGSHTSRTSDKFATERHSLKPPVSAITKSRSGTGINSESRSAGANDSRVSGSRIDPASSSSRSKSSLSMSSAAAAGLSAGNLSSGMGSPLNRSSVTPSRHGRSSTLSTARVSPMSTDGYFGSKAAEDSAQIAAAAVSSMRRSLSLEQFPPSGGRSPLVRPSFNPPIGTTMETLMEVPFEAGTGTTTPVITTVSPPVTQAPTVMDLSPTHPPSVDPRDLPVKMDASMLQLKSTSKPRLIIVSYRLPVKIQRLKSSEGTIMRSDSGGGNEICIDDTIPVYSPMAPPKVSPSVDPKMHSLSSLPSSSKSSGSGMKRTKATLGRTKSRPLSTESSSGRGTRDSQESSDSFLGEDTSDMPSQWHIEYNDMRDFLANLRIFESKYEVHFVGWPGLFSDDLTVSEREELTDELYSLPFPCHAVFLSREQKASFYDEMCRNILWTLFHYMTLSGDAGNTSAFGANFHDLWQVYTNVNNMYARTALLATDADIDQDGVTADANTFLWFHNYHLSLAPAFVRRRKPMARIGYFMHTVFPTSEVLRVLPTMNELLRGILSCDLIGFHTFDYARHFLSACKRGLDLDFHTRSDDGTLVVRTLGRDVSIRINHVSICSNLIKKKSETMVVRSIANDRWRKLKNDGKRRMVVGVGDIELVQGTVLSLQGLYSFLREHPRWAKEVVFVFVLRKRARTVRGDEKVERALSLVDREVEYIRKHFGKDIIHLYKEEDVHSHSVLLGLYMVADVVIFGTFWDGFNTLPYEVTAVQGDRDDPAFIILSEFMGSARSLSGVSRVNPWNLQGVCSAIHEALLMTNAERKEAHNRRYHHVMTYTFYEWADAFLLDLHKASKRDADMRVISMGIGATMVSVMLDRRLQKLRDVKDLLTSSFMNASKRVLLFDYGGTLAKLTDKALGGSFYLPIAPQEEHERRMGKGHSSDVFGRSISKELIPPPKAIMDLLENLAKRPDTLVCVVSGHTRRELDSGFSGRMTKNIAFAAEKGAFYRWPNSLTWVPNESLEDCSKWQALALPVLKQYTDRTDGSYIQKKDTALVWHYHESDPEYGDMQAIELGRHLRRVLQPLYNVTVQAYDHAKILEILPNEIHKGTAARAVINQALYGHHHARNGGRGLMNVTDEDIFLLSVGDDRSDEKMFESVQRYAAKLRCESNTYTCTIGIQPTEAHYYLNSQSDIEWLLSTLACIPEYGSRRREPPPLIHYSSIPTNLAGISTAAAAAAAAVSGGSSSTASLATTPVGGGGGSMSQSGSPVSPYTYLPRATGPRSVSLTAVSSMGRITTDAATAAKVAAAARFGSGKGGGMRPIGTWHHRLSEGSKMVSSSSAASTAARRRHFHATTSSLDDLKTPRSRKTSSSSLGFGDVFHSTGNLQSIKESRSIAGSAEKHRRGFY